MRIYKYFHKLPHAFRDELVLRLTSQMLHMAVCAYVPSLTHSSLQQKQGLPLLNQIISWATLGRCVCACERSHKLVWINQKENNLKDS